MGPRSGGSDRDWRKRRLDIRVILLAVTPLFLLPAQSYGGEMLIRVSLFALPFIAVQASSILLPTASRARPSSPAKAGLTAGSLVLTCFLLAVLTVTGRFGNGRYDMFTDSAVAAVAAANRIAPPSSAIISAAHPTPWRSEAYLEHKYRTFDELCGPELSTMTCGPRLYGCARHNPAGAVVLLMRSSEASLVLRGVTSAQGIQELEKWLGAQDGVELAFSNADARVYRVAP
ncbi:hypothetical protein [Pseudarthrobacter sp. NamE5]|uniref:hypothetical protein n=1 Tax=Pseudarthrobacter sp. NamE5 TaxID=2576839 RepID=UPI001F0FF960|nr:hypothetical protein [Pseudarthrobacter sp. NamE5]